MTEAALLATCWTTAGDAAPYPGQHASPLPLETRVAAAQRAGFIGFGILDHDLRRFLETSDLETLAALLRDHGMSVIEMEFLTRWWMTGPERAESDRSRDLLLTGAQALGAHHIKVAPDVESPQLDIDLWAEEFAILAQQASDHGTRVALEFMPFANVSSLHAALEIVARAGHPAGGLLLDVWHLERSGASPADLRAVPIESVFAVELDDGSSIPQGDPYDDTCLRRLIPGQGDFRVVEFARELIRMGWTLPWGVEIINESYRTRRLDDALADVVAGTRDQLSLAYATA